jgi:hypothetical protein
LLIELGREHDLAEVVQRGVEAEEIEASRLGPGDDLERLSLADDDRLAVLGEPGGEGDLTLVVDRRVGSEEGEAIGVVGDRRQRSVRLRAEDRLNAFGREGREGDLARVVDRRAPVGRQALGGVGDLRERVRLGLRLGGGGERGKQRECEQDDEPCLVGRSRVRPPP